MKSPYQQALDWIERHPGTGSAGRLAKLLLSLWNSDACFAFRECIECLDEQRTQIALDCVRHFAQHGEDAELVRIGYRVYELCPRVWELGFAGHEAKCALSAAWDQERQRELEREEEEQLERQRQLEREEELERELELEREELQRDCGDAAEWDSPGVRR